MRSNETLPVLATTRLAYRLLWRHRGLHAKAIWPPVVFLVLAEFLYHRVTGNAHGLSGKWHSVLAAPWYVPIGAAVAWLIGLKFLLSFSVSWRRHLLLGETFDPFFFKAPFWKYLGFLVLTYVWAIPVLLLSSVPALVFAASRSATTVDHSIADRVLLVFVPFAAALTLWAIIRQVPYFNALTQDPPQPRWRDSVVAMRGMVWRYAAAWMLAMLPIAILDLLLDAGLKHFGADPHLVPVALGESAFRQAMLFLHFSLGASIGAFTYTVTIIGDRQCLAASIPIKFVARPGTALGARH
jgi:hypothetical protein